VRVQCGESEDVLVGSSFTTASLISSCIPIGSAGAWSYSRTQTSFCPGDQISFAFYAGDLATARQFYVQASQSAAHSADHSLILTTKFNLAKIAVDQGHPAESIAVLHSIQEQAGKSGPKFLATQSAIWLGKSYLLAKDPAKARDVLQSAVLQAEKLGLSGLKAQGHALLSAAMRKLGNAAEADAESKAASQIFDQIQAEAHFDPRTRHDFALGSS
jgi:hypothetical protein